MAKPVQGQILSYIQKSTGPFHEHQLTTVDKRKQNIFIVRALKVHTRSPIKTNTSIQFLLFPLGLND